MFRAQLRLTLSQAARRGFEMSYEKEPNHIYAQEHKIYLLHHFGGHWKNYNDNKRVNYIFSRKWTEYCSSFSILIGFPHATTVWFSLFIVLF